MAGMTPKAISIVGFKNSGKTRVAEVLIKKLVERGHRVGTLKHTAEDIQLDTPGKDTHRHRMAGASSSGILHESGSAFFIDRYVSFHTAVSYLGKLDFLVIEGFKTINTQAKILIPRKQADINTLIDGLVIGIVQVPEVESLESDLPIISLKDGISLVDLVEKKAFKLLPGLNCHECGYDDCFEMGKALLKRESEISQCIGFKDGFSLKVNGIEVPLKGFVRDALEGVVIGFVKTLKGVEDARNIELKFEGS
jgi:molybdopterin-guanine dinucleotide biosynthesis protein B